MTPANGKDGTGDALTFDGLSNDTPYRVVAKDKSTANAVPVVLGSVTTNVPVNPGDTVTANNETVAKRTGAPGATVTVAGSGGAEPVTVTVPDGSGVSADRKTGAVTVPGGSTVSKCQGGNLVTVTVPAGTPAVVDKDGTVTFPQGGKVKIKKGGTETTVTVKPGESISVDSSGSSGGSGGGSAVTYAPTVIQPDHGKVTVQPRNPGQGEKVTVTLTPDQGYRANGLTVTDQNGKPVEVAENADGTYTFIQPVGKVTVKASFAAAGSGAYASCSKDSSCPIARFEDASPTAWYHDGVHYCIGNGLMAGHDTGLFGPGDHLTRAQFAQILYNKEGKPAVTGNSVFTDVADGQWYAPAVTWAAANGVVNGYDNGQFGPNDKITREQLAIMLWRYSGSPAAAEKERNFNDADEISGFALDAMRWAVENGIIGGYGDGRLDPKGLATRAQAAAMLQRFFQQT